MKRKGEKNAFPAPVAGEEQEVAQWLKLAQKLSLQYYHKHYRSVSHNAYSAEMIFEDAQIGLLRGVRTYQPERGVPKSSYYSLCIKSAINNAYYKYGEFVPATASTGFISTRYYSDCTLVENEYIDDNTKDYELLYSLSDDFTTAEVDALVATKQMFGKTHKGVCRKEVLPVATAKFERWQRSLAR